MSVECDEPRPGWGLGIGGSKVPFLMLNFVGNVQQPFGPTRFDNYSLIDQLFQRIEPHLLSVNFEDLWMPIFLFHGEP
jgi:hypothetical protein